MKTIILELRSNDDLFEIVDRSFDHILISRFNPHQETRWRPASINIQPDVSLENIMVRSMQFDIRTDLAGLEKISQINSGYLTFYQFDRPVANAFVIDDLPENNRENILKQNGLQHVYYVEHEKLIIDSFSPDFIQKINDDNRFKKLYVNLS